MDHLVGFSILFVVSHMVLSAYPVRQRLIGAFGLGPFLGGYSLIAGGLFWGLLSSYFEAPDILVWHPPTAFRHLAISVMPLCCVFLVTGYSSANPAAIGSERMVALDEQPQGIYRVTRHPVLWAVGLWALVHFLSSGTSSTMVLFGTMAVLAFAGSVHMDYRKSLERGVEWQDYLLRTSSIPFLAIGQGRQQFLWREIGLWRLALAVIMYCGLLVVHEAITGVPPLPVPP
jgi:uncharacterized membrane protein